MLALLAGTLPIDRLAAMRLIVTPGTILRWHRDIIITAGEACFTFDRKARGRAGQTIIVPTGVRHSEGKPGPAEIQAVLERPQE